MNFDYMICEGCNRYSVLCDADPVPCVGCTCEYTYENEWWWPLYWAVIGVGQ